MNGFKPSSKIFLLTFPRRYFFCGSFVLCMSCVSHAFASVHCCLVSPTGKGLTLWLLLVMSIVVWYFPMWYPWSGVVLDCIFSGTLPSASLCWVVSFNFIKLLKVHYLSEQWRT